MTRQLKTPRGFDLVYEASSALPLVDVAVLWRAGALNDPEGQEGLSRLLGHVLQRGQRRQSANQVDHALARMGARLQLSVSREAIRIQGCVLSRNLPAFLELLGGLVLEPALRAKDLAREKRRTRAAIADVRDDDGALAATAFRKHLFQDHPYARSVRGSVCSLRRIQRDDLKALHAKTVRRGAFSFGVSGDVEVDVAAQCIDDAFGAAPRGKGSLPRARRPRRKAGRELIIIDKRDRSQTQLGMGTLSTTMHDPRRTALVVADSVFGGLFTSRLMQAVRAKRGYSYSAYSQLSLPNARGSWSMWTHPSARNVGACATLQLELLQDWVERGLRAKEVQFAKRYLIGSRCLEVDTASARVDLALESLYRGYEISYPKKFTKRIRGVSAKAANAAVRECIDPSALTIVAVGDSRQLVPELSALKGVSEVRVVPYDAP